ncbi:MAG: RagB/SusD family nutrient uptake outer membrane protein [Bacteroidaceae bacterium]|nr:RagB/SusD family nutrient uptake outer membrane protein [Bacteroidaceae bacterium]
MKLKNMISVIKRGLLSGKVGGGFLCGLCLLSTLSVTTSCEDMLDKGNDYVIYADDRLISNPADTVTSVLGILNKLQGIAVRTNLFGELRADLVEVRDNATIDIKDIASLEIGDDNAYNNPRDYYAVINNCNYFLAHADPNAGNANRNEKYFEAEIAQVHSIRAWTYLQMVLVYGSVPFVTEPIVKENQSHEDDYDWYDLQQICQYFINDLMPYYGKAYPEYGSIGGDIDPELCFYPTQVVMGDLYLWLAACTQDKEMAKLAAKAYYDYIIWDLNGKQYLYTTNARVYWGETALKESRFMMGPSGAATNFNQMRSAWGTQVQEFVTAIPMDSASADGYYNELRKLYNVQYEEGGELIEASITPSNVIRDLSKAQTYVGYYTDGISKRWVTLQESDFTEEEINDGYFGDLRFCEDFLQRTTKYNSKEVDLQYIMKHRYQHIGIYRSAQIYLRMAEALNYAGYPQFAKQILTMGLSDDVIQCEVLRFYPTKADSAYIQQFEFNDTYFKPYVNNYAIKTRYGVVYGWEPQARSDRELTSCNMWGIHGRGSGYPFMDPNYAALAVDSTTYPYDVMGSIGKQPVKGDYPYPSEGELLKKNFKPESWTRYPYQLTVAEYISLYNIVLSIRDQRKYNNTGTFDKYDNYVDSVSKYRSYLALQEETDRLDDIFADDLAAYNARVKVFQDADYAWREQTYNDPALVAQQQEIIDRCILDEQALELVYEGNRFYDLMRRAYWYGDNSILANAVSQRNAAVGSRLSDRHNWFVKYKGKFGLK